MKKLILAFMPFLISFPGLDLQAQCKIPDYGEDKVKAELNLAIYSDNYKSGKFSEARASLNWLLANAPKVGTKIYVDGVDIYDKLATAEKDPTIKQKYVDSVMIIFDLRVANCGEEAVVLNRKANSMFKYYYKVKEKLPDLVSLYDKVFELNGNNILDQSLELYMKTIQLNADFNKNMSDVQILERYDKIMNAIDAKIKKAMEANKPQDVEKLKAMKIKVDDTLTAIKALKFDCKMVKEKLEPKFRQNPTDLGLARKIFNFMLQDKCIDDPLWLETGEAIKDVEPKDFGLIKTLAVKHLSNENVPKAEALIKEAQVVATKPEQKSEALMIQATIEIKKGNKIGARELLKQAAATDPKNKEALSKIGDLYYNSFDDCSRKQNMAEDRLVYLAAFEMFQRAGDAQGMAKAKAQFPSREEIFLVNWKVGEVKKISNCWVGETVSIKTRD